MDTWMDSSITALHAGGWPEGDFEPTALREQGHDIIRTWAFYTILRTAALEDEVPWEEALINGMVFGDDGNKMSKSRGNFVQPEAVVEEHSADAFRQAMALGGQPGSDIQFQWKEVTSANRFLTKVWNISTFALEHVEEDTPTIEDPAYRDADEWILTRASQTVATVEQDMLEYRFDAALRTIREFVWHDLADDYLELVKGRLYEGRPGERDAARHALYTALSASLRMLAPFSPFATEEIWDALPGADGSVHAADWPTIDVEDERALLAGDVIADVARSVRGWKSDSGMALNSDLERVDVYLDEEAVPRDALEDQPIDIYDLSAALNGPVSIDRGEPAVELVPVGVDPDHSKIGPEFRDRAGAVVGALEEADPAAIAREKRRQGEIELDVGGEVLVLDGEWVTIEAEHRAESGAAVEVLEGDYGTILVQE
jgi:valyl-tRNA synthetase